ncbi:MAG: InlB B-repeat-containing protein [Clostridia bacterium]|nr:InlB B-repeat-containing protein [Clostridia bacterium]
MKTEAARRALALSVATVAVLLLLLSACAQKAYECGYFTYKIVRYGETEQAFILGLTEEGQKQEYLVVPEEVDGIKVTCIDGFAEAPKLKKIFIPKNVVSVNNRMNSVMLQRNAFIQGNTSYKALYFHDKIGPFLIVGGENAFFAENATYEAHGALLTSFTPKKANVCYYLNETDKDVYFLDDLEKGEKIEFLPPDPRKDGFAFKGWSTSPSDNTSFDFAAYQKSDDTVLRLFAMWEER